MSAYQMFVCKACGRKRRIYRSASVRQGFYRWMCSQGHEWTTEVPTMDKIVDITRAAVVDNMRRIFSEDNPMFRVLRRR